MMRSVKAWGTALGPLAAAMVASADDLVMLSNIEPPERSSPIENIRNADGSAPARPSSGSASA